MGKKSKEFLSYNIEKMKKKVHPSVAIILLNYNGENDTIACIESIKKIDYQNYKLFLVDNNSEKKSKKILEEYCKENLEIKFIKNLENNGFSAGNNIALKEALVSDFDYFLLLNNDTEVKKDFLSKLINISELNKNAGLLTSKIYFYDKPNIIWHAVCKFSWIGGGRPLQYKELDKYPYDNEVKKTEYVSGCVMLIKREVVEKIGYLDENFFMYYEDTDFSLRAKRAGFELLYVPDSHIWHKVSQSTKKVMTYPIVHYYHIRNALLLSKRQAPKIILGGIYTWSALHFIKQILKLVILPKKRESSKMIMRGIIDFYRGRFGKYEKR